MSNAYGSLQFPALRKAVLGAGVQTDLVTLLGPGSRVAAYVRSTGPQSGDDPEIAMRMVSTLNAGLAQCRSGMGDVVVVLPGHVESISGADYMSSLVAGTRIVGLGHGTLKPTFHWSAAASTFLFDVANTHLSGCRLNFAGDPTLTAALTVAAPITVSAAGCSILNCDIQTSVDADQLSTIGVTTTAAADDFTIGGCHFFGATAGESTTMVRLVGADRFKMFGCFLHGATSSTTVGVLQMLTTASLDVWIEGCTFINRKAASVHAATGMAAATGVVKDCAFGILDNATLPGWETEGDLMFFGCQTVNLAGEKGVPATPLSTV